MLVARFTQLIVVDFFTLRTKVIPRMLGPNLSLVVAQSKGWPFITLLWAIWDFALLFGDRKFANHRAYWQGFIDLMNETNPSGDVTTHSGYRRVLISAVFVPVAVAAKRSIMGQIVGKRVVRK